jgi:ABC-type branched-subunit amino acid transport system permease subunit
MAFKIFSGIVAAALLLIFIGPVVVKLKEISLSIVVLIGLVMMVTDIWHALSSKDD